VVGTVVNQYASSGFLWENYHAVTGVGRGTHPFTGWTSLVVLILADQY
jgi:mannosyl-oligosaccharide glucosidase